MTLFTNIAFTNIAFNSIFYFFAFVFGACIGSLLNCVIFYLEEKRSSLWGRSFCPHCKHQLGFWDLIPIFSFVFLAGKCRYCKKPISIQYPLVETGMGVLFVLICHFCLFPYFNQLNTTAIAVVLSFYYFIVASLLVVIFVYDLKHYLIPDKIIWLGIAVVFLFRILDFKSLLNPVFSAVSAGGFFFLIWLVSRGKWMGFGDVYLAFFIGLFLGWPNILVALFSGFFIGAIIGIVMIAAGKKELQSKIPFAPFLTAGTFISLFFGQQIINWYLNLFL